MPQSATIPRHREQRQLHFRRIANAALAVLPAILDRLGVPWRRAGAEIDMLATHRGDRSFGSFRVNTRTGRWADFATGDRGGDVVSLVAYLRGSDQAQAARDLARFLGMEADDDR